MIVTTGKRAGSQAAEQPIIHESMANGCQFSVVDDDDNDHRKQFDEHSKCRDFNLIYPYRFGLPPF